MKKPQTTPEKPVSTTTTEQPIAPKATKAAPKKTSEVKPAQKKAEPVVAETKAEQPIATATAPATPKKPAPKPLPVKKVATKSTTPAAATPELPTVERVGLTAGSIWHYLSENGATPVSKLVAALSEEEKIIQRSIGWLAQEDKITIDTTNRIETIALKA